MKTQERLTKKEQVKAHKALAAALAKFSNEVGLRVEEYSTHCDYLVITKGDRLQGSHEVARVIGDFYDKFPGFPLEFMTIQQEQGVTISSWGREIPLPKVYKADSDVR